MFIVMTIRDNVPEDVIGVFVERELAQKCFLDACSTRLSNWDEYDDEDKEAILDQGYEEFNNGSITYIDTAGHCDDSTIVSSRGKYDNHCS